MQFNCSEVVAAAFSSVGGDDGGLIGWLLGWSVDWLVEVVVLVVGGFVLVISDSRK